MMQEKKNLDRLFQEKFKDFEVAPDEAVWEKIKARKEKNKKERALLIPLWLRIAGAAALIALLFTLGSQWIINDPTQPEITNAKTQNKEVPSKDQIYTGSDTETEIVQELNTKNIEILEKTNENGTQNTTNTLNSNKKTKYPLVSSENNVETTLTTRENNDKTSSKKNSMSNTNQLRIEISSGVAQSTYKNDRITALKTSEKQGVAQQNNDISRIISDPDKTNKDLADPNISNAIAQKVEEPKEEANTKSIFDAIKAEKEIQEDETKVANTKTKRWKVAPNVAPVYYNSLGNGSSVDTEFIDNTKQGQVNMSYGVQIAYAINEKLSIRSGVNAVNLGYGTQDVGFSPSPSAQSLENVSYGTNSQSIQLTDYQPGSSPRSFIASEIRESRKISTQNKGVLNLVMNYIEIPMEMKYALIDKKVGVHVIGGVSTLLLQDHQLTVDAGDFTTDVGESTNLNDISFSSNVGIGIDYQLSDKFQVQMEPIFKYQINAYENTAGNFNPYYFGVYTGVSYKF